METDIKRNHTDIEDVRKLLGETESNLLDCMDGQKRQLESMIKNHQSNDPSPGAHHRISAKNEESYWLHRRSLSIWPVLGDDNIAGVKEFFISKLKLSEEQVRDLGKVMVRKLKEPSSKARKEVFCTFETRETRDLVKAAGKNLAGSGAECRLRAQFPGFLLDTFRLFESIAYHLRGGDQSIRRAVKFDDTSFDLMMDIKVGDEWKRIRPAEARATLEKNPHIKRGPIEMSSDCLSDLLEKKRRIKPRQLGQMPSQQTNDGKIRVLLSLLTFLMFLICTLLCPMITCCRIARMEAMTVLTQPKVDRAIESSTLIA